ncbi:molybdopterin-dependent oxidoreductase [Natronomonas marina]|jgi:DMSO/TMAO reductase YedYZ molybdopterin-dependent catalytic subunit|uniref:molybdopterin-dependent oxidoreductase n=1 Tax=Natronomonas marina TaxID=2961939 RepID=UPI0020C9811F|nr:molybdopterin-dependent oxidoreductase [Natronomonas marina]
MNDSSRTGVLGRLPGAWALLVAACAGAAGVAGSFAVAAFTPSFVAGPIAGLLAREMPAVVVRYAITVLGDLGSKLNIVAALAISTAVFAAAALVGLGVARRTDLPPVGPPVGGALAAGAAYAVTAVPLPSAVAGLAVGGVLAAAAFASLPDLETVSEERRRVLGGAASALAFVGGGYLLGGRGGFTEPSGAGEPLEVNSVLQAEIDQRLSQAEGQSLDVEGLEALVSEDFYEVDINATDPTLDAAEWELTVTGAVEEEVSYTYADVREMDAENRFVSLRCVGERLNGRKMDNALWTGVPIMDLVEPAGPAEECCVMLRAADDFYEEFPLSALEDGFLAFGMNGETLPAGHGYPARALIPGHWGEINVKWITEIEILEEEADGYWEERGWHGTGPVNTVAKLHLEESLDDGLIRVGGHAYAGTRGVGSVEVSIDGGDTWTEADLSEPLPGDDVWRQWVHTYDPPDGEHEVVVRAIETDGTVQPSDETDAFPSGPSGWVSRTVEP